MAKKSLLSIFATSWNRESLKFGELQKSEKKATSYSFAIKAIIIALAIAGFGALIGLTVKPLSTISGSALNILWWLDLLGLVCFALCEVLLLPMGLIDLIYQFRLNRKPMSWIALLLYVLGIVGAVLLVYLFIR